MLGPDYLLATADAGNHWTVQLSSRTSLWSSLDFINRSTGWVIGAHDLLATTDGGRRWHAVPQTCPAIESLDFVTPRVGFAIASGAAAPLGEAWANNTAALLTSHDAGRTWKHVATPKQPQSVCFYTPKRGWLAAHGSIYSTRDSGRRWRLDFTDSFRPTAFTATIAVQCTGPDVGWAEAVGPGGEMSQEPHVGLHGTGSTWKALFAEQYFPHPGIPTTMNSPSSDASTFAAINASHAVFLDECTACGYGIETIGFVTGTRLTRARDIPGINGSVSASFTSPTDGWVIGVRVHDATFSYRVIHTTDGGTTWHTQFIMPTGKG